jgi:hypothetical protein
MKKKNYSTVGLKRIVLSIFVVALLGVFIWAGYYYFITSKNPVSFVTIDINPSVELAVNSSDVVVDVVALNDDADIITADLDLIGLDVEEASEKVIEAAVETGYIDELSEDNTVVVTSSCDDEEKRVELEQKVMEKLDSYLTDNKVYALLAAQGVDDELKAEADQYDISYGKMLLVNRAIALDSTLSKDDLVNSSVQDIQKEIKGSMQSRYEVKNMTKEELQNQWKEQKQEKIEATEQKLEQKKQELWNENKGKYNNASEAEKDDIVDELMEKEKEQIKNNLDEVQEEIQQEQSSNQNGSQGEVKPSYPVIEKGNKTEEAVQSRKGKN